MPGKEKKKRNASHNPLGDDLNADRFARIKRQFPGEAAVEDDGGYLIPNRTTQRILKVARKQLEDDEDDAEDDGIAPAEAEDGADTDVNGFERAEGEADEDGGDDVFIEYDEGESIASEVPEFNDMGQEYQISDEEARLLEKFNPTSSIRTRNLADIIMDKIKEKEMEAKTADGQSDQGHGDSKIDRRVARVYSAIGSILKSYSSGKIPKAFKVLPHIQNWEQLLALTRPHEWSPHATYQAAKIFASNLNEKMAQRFYNAFLLPICIHWMQEERKLHPSLYMALRKALFKPVAFYKGFLIPLCHSEDCTLKMSLIVASVLQKMHLPPVPTAVAIVKISTLPFSGPNCVLLRVLIDKKMALPYQAVDALVKHFHRFTQTHSKEDVLPVLWHQTLLSFVQRYKQDLTAEQLELLSNLCLKHFHYLITPEVRREIAVAQRK
jgi:essential nuclear protein 1